MILLQFDMKLILAKFEPFKPLNYDQEQKITENCGEKTDRRSMSFVDFSLKLSFYPIYICFIRNSRP